MPSCHLVQTDASLATYYTERAPEMEEAYRLPQRQADLARLREELVRLVAGQDVFEVACGTGYWSQVMASTAHTVMATDVSPDMLNLARAKTYGPAQVVLREANAWCLEDIPGTYTAGAALFWWSHMPRSRIRDFLRQLHRVLQLGAQVIVADNLPADCRHTPSVSVDAEGNTYQRRMLRSGRTFDIIKNYPSGEEVCGSLAGLAKEIEYTAFTCVWLLSYRTTTR